VCHGPHAPYFSPCFADRRVRLPFFAGLFTRMQSWHTHMSQLSQQLIMAFFFCLMLADNVVEQLLKQHLV
jgi:hypothetical protein